jgi:hypothetical protein
MSQTKFSNPVNPSTGPMSPSPSAETVKGGRGTTTSGAKTTHEQDSGAEKIGYGTDDQDKSDRGLSDRNQMSQADLGNRRSVWQMKNKRPQADRNQNDQQERQAV